MRRCGPALATEAQKALFAKRQSEGQPGGTKKREATEARKSDVDPTDPRWAPAPDPQLAPQRRVESAAARARCARAPLVVGGQAD